MKNASSILAATLILFFGFQGSVTAQKTATWKGGTPGRSSDWNCASNWKEGRIPDEFSHVFIPDVSTSTFTYPVIQEGEIEILSLTCAPLAKVIQRNNARLIVLELAPDTLYNATYARRTQHINMLPASSKQ